MKKENTTRFPELYERTGTVVLWITKKLGMPIFSISYPFKKRGVISGIPSLWEYGTYSKFPQQVILKDRGWVKEMVDKIIQNQCVSYDFSEEIFDQITKENNIVLTF